MGCVAGSGGHSKETMKLKRILMTEEGSSPGGGAVVPASTSVPTQGAPSAPTVPADQIKGLIAEAFGELRNGLFADLRKAGALGKEKAPVENPAPPATQQTSGAAAPSPGLSMADVKGEIERASIAGELAGKHGLTPTQAGHMKNALSGISDPAAYRAAADSYLTDMGLAKAPTAAPAAPAATTAAVASTTAPAPAAAPAAPTAHTLPTANGVVDIFQPGVAQTLGPAGLREHLEKLWAMGNQMQGAPTRPKPPSQR